MTHCRPDISLPGEAPGVIRWTVGRKAELVRRVRRGLISCADAIARFGLTAEEFDGWARAVQRYGTAGLRVTRLQHYPEARAHD